MNGIGVTIFFFIYFFNKRHQSSPLRITSCWIIEQVPSHTQYPYERAIICGQPYERVMTSNPTLIIWKLEFYFHKWVNWKNADCWNEFNIEEMWEKICFLVRPQNWENTREDFFLCFRLIFCFYTVTCSTSNRFFT